MKKETFLLAGLFMLMFSVSSEVLLAQSKTTKKPNVIFIIGDDVGYGDLSYNGQKTIHTPNVDKLAAEGLRFTDAHTTAATCTPSRYSLFTGQYNWRKKGTGIATGDAGMVIRPEQTTVADMFQAAGYTTGAIGKWHLGLGDTQGSQDWNGFVTPGPKDIGFDYSFLMAATGDRVPCVWVENQKVSNYDASAPIEVSYKAPIPGEPLGKDHPELLTKSKPSHGHDQAIVNGISRIGYMKGGGKALWQDEDIADTLASKAAQFIKNNGEKPFFLYVGTNDIHVPRYPHSRFRGKSGMGYRGDAILQFDWTVGEIVKALKEAGIYENTLIVLSSDNGPVVDDGYIDQAEELLGKHKPWSHFHHRGGKYSNFEAGTRVPFLVTWPSGVKPGVSNALVSQVDLFASMSALIGQKPKAGAGPDSQNQLAAFLGRDKKGRKYVIESAGALSVTTGSWKYITPSNGVAFAKPTQTATGNSKEDQLYNIANDIAETKNLATKYPKKVAELKKIIETEKSKGFQQ